MLVFVVLTISLFTPHWELSAAPSREATPNPQAAPGDHQQEGEAITVHTRWLPNGVRVVTVTGPWPGEMVSIRLLIDGGLATAKAPEKYSVHFLEHLVFQYRKNDQHAFKTAGEGGGCSRAYVSLAHQMHEHDVAVAQARVILRGMVSEWERAAFDVVHVETERRRLKHELGSSGYHPFLIALANDLQPLGMLTYSNAAERAFVDTVSAVTLRRLFNERYVAGRLTLVVAANAHTLSTLEDEIASFARIPAGAGDTDSGDLSWLSGDVRTAAPFGGTGHVGFRFRNPTDVSSRIRDLIGGAVAERCAEVFAENACEAVDPDVEDHRTPKEEVWVYAVNNTACMVDDEPAAYRIFEESLEYLATPAALEWWRKAIEKDTKENDLLDDRSDTVADMVVWAFIGSAQETAAPSWGDCAGPIDPDEIVQAAKRLRESAVVFRVYRDKRRYDLKYADDALTSSGGESGASKDLLADFLALETGRDPAWPAVTFFSVVMTASAAFGLALTGVVRRAKTRETKIRSRFAFSKKRGRDEE